MARLVWCPLFLAIMTCVGSCSAGSIHPVLAISYSLFSEKGFVYHDTEYRTVFFGFSVRSDGVLADAGRERAWPQCSRVSRHQVRKLQALLTATEFAREFDRIAVPLETPPAPEGQTDVTLLIGQRKATFLRSNVPAGVLPVLRYLDALYRDGCHAEPNSFLGDTEAGK